MLARTPLLFVASSLVACGGAASAAPPPTTSSGATTYEIHLTRHMRVGATWAERAHFASHHETHVTDASGAAVSDQTETADLLLAGQYTVLAVGPDGDPTQLQLALQLFSVDVGQGVTVPPMPATILIDRRAGGAITGGGGEPLAADIVALLRNLVPDHPPPVDDDLVFGTRERVAVGAHWPIDSTGAAHALQALQLTVSPADVSGQTTLVAHDTARGPEAIEVRSEIAAHHVGLPGLPPGSVEQRAELAAGVDALLPLDVSLPPIAEIERSAVQVVVTVPSPTGPQTVSVTVEEETEHGRDL